MHNSTFKGRRLNGRQVNPGELTTEQRARIDDEIRRCGLEAGSADRLMKAACGRIDDERLEWVIARVPVGQERIASDELKARSIAVWCPMASERRNAKRGRPAVTVERPIFTGYVFLRLPDCAEAWIGAGIAGRVTGYLGVDGVPAKIPASEINTLMIKVKSPEVASLVPRIRAGMSAIVRDGPFAAFEAKIRRVMRSHGRAEVEVNIFGRITPVELGLDQLKI
ncbi:transcription termination/antitermination protein NusG [Hoeflea sp. YIM 152468]|uniref:transcription termination/antitermination protein NusG n=1 Tax=Hoeflea sp. YIM 152468 TaxID=3031759 RepID=UPI0023DB9C60|nr:transcription termination/antitermination protein NusG [Hoeflea sp. YIM 152468]MDF1606967.1 transcription termination/antitermination protein NusG [Hoeflea sp. YIM 152468]